MNEYLPDTQTLSYSDSMLAPSTSKCSKAML